VPLVQRLEETRADVGQHVPSLEGNAGDRRVQRGVGCQRRDEGVEVRLATAATKGWVPTSVPD
jgi:hypothetical protein